MAMQAVTAATIDRLMTVTAEGGPSLPEIVSRYLDGTSLQELAAECKRSRRSLYHWMLSGLGDKRYAEMVTEVLISRIADADEDLEAARGMGDPVRVSACREVCRFVRMDFERRRPALYGVKQEGGPATVVHVHIGQALRDPPAGMIVDNSEVEP